MDFNLRLTFIVVSFFLFFEYTYGQTPQEQNGARIYYLHCTLCHGSQGMGEGSLAIALDNYPETSLLEIQTRKSKEELVEIIQKGNKLPGVSEYMPPWEEALGQKALDDVAQFIILLRENTAKALELTRFESENDFSDSDKGRVVYKSYCVKCHGIKGLGDGKMRKVVNAPPPSDLTKSIANIEYLRLIIAEGGGMIGRSPQMPPWKDELSDQEILSVSKYLMTLR